MNTSTHRLLKYFGPLTERKMRIEMRDDSMFILTSIVPVDLTVYERSGILTAEVISFVIDPDNRFHRPGNGLDFNEEDVLKISDEDTGREIVNFTEMS